MIKTFNCTNNGIENKTIKINHAQLQNRLSTENYFELFLHLNKIIVNMNNL